MGCVGFSSLDRPGTPSKTLCDLQRPNRKIHKCYLFSCAFTIRAKICEIRCEFRHIFTGAGNPGSEVLVDFGSKSAQSSQNPIVPGPFLCKICKILENRRNSPNFRVRSRKSQSVFDRFPGRSETFFPRRPSDLHASISGPSSTRCAPSFRAHPLVERRSNGTRSASSG